MGLPPNLVTGFGPNLPGVEKVFAKFGDRPRGRGRVTPKLDLAGMNKTERKYAAVLDLRKKAGEIANWAFQPLRLHLAGDKKTTYTPDFVILHNDGLLECVEIKGFREDDAMVKFKLARALLPCLTFTMLEFQKGSFVEVLKAPEEKNDADAN